MRLFEDYGAAIEQKQKLAPFGLLLMLICSLQTQLRLVPLSILKQSIFERRSKLNKLYGRNPMAVEVYLRLYRSMMRRNENGVGGVAIEYRVGTCI